jgi:hypothetical protein
MSRARGIVGPHSVFDRILFFFPAPQPAGAVAATHAGIKLRKKKEEEARARSIAPLIMFLFSPLVPSFRST